MSKGDSKGYLITNCLYGLAEKKYQFKENDQKIINGITDFILTDPAYHALRPFSQLLSNRDLTELKTVIVEKLTFQFTLDLYYEAVLAECLDEPAKFVIEYSLEIQRILNLIIQPFLKIIVL